MDTLCKHAAAEEVTLLKSCYDLDENCRPAQYVLSKMTTVPVDSRVRTEAKLKAVLKVSSSA